VITELDGDEFCNAPAQSVNQRKPNGSRETFGGNTAIAVLVRCAPECDRDVGDLLQQVRQCGALSGISAHPDRRRRGSLISAQAGEAAASRADKPVVELIDDKGDQPHPYPGPQRRIDKVCHSLIRDGQIQFLTDCTHELAGQTVPLAPIDD
jgi:hypothetical protein